MRTPGGKFLSRPPDPWRDFCWRPIVIAAVIASGHGVVFVFGGQFGVMASAAIGNPQLSFLANSLLFVTIVYGILNLLPIYPLDGGQIARELLVMLLGRDGVRQSLILSMFVSGVLALMGAFMWQSIFLAIFFAYFAYSSYMTLQSYSYRGPRF